MVLFLLLIIAAVALGIVGAVIHGLLYLLVIGVVIFLLSWVLLGARMHGRRHRPARLALCWPSAARR